MQKIKIKNTEYLIKPSVYVLIKYRQLFNSELLADIKNLDKDYILENLGESLEKIYKLIYTLIICGGNDVTSFNEWLTENIDADIFETIPQILEILNNSIQLLTAKKQMITPTTQ